MSWYPLKPRAKGVVLRYLRLLRWKCLDNLVRKRKHTDFTHISRDYRLKMPVVHIFTRLSLTTAKHFPGTFPTSTAAQLCILLQFLHS